MGVMAIASAAASAIQDGNITDADGNSIEFEMTPEEQAAWDEAAASAGPAMGLVVIALICQLYSFIATCMFICCDSGKSRKAYALAILIGAIAGLLMNQNLGQIVWAALGAYWAFEMNKLAEMHDDYAKM